MNTNLPQARDKNVLGSPIGSEYSLDEQLLEIYWAKKELEEFLPKIATYAHAHEVANIALSQLSMIEKRIIWILESESKGLIKHSGNK
ncbi:hypothetical protein [Flavobacterium sp.]|uniref:hypothetical protein n=1 Tax=Flavobacterium sp. TaxID=239 RepID=UPI00286A4FF5|nr:hypothetical protein [Flavobacterium sp.]